MARFYLSNRLTSTLWMCVLTLVGCSTTIETDDVEPTFELPADWYNATDEGDPVDEEWCHDFGEPFLSELIDDVYAHNLDLRIARARIDEARALRRQSRSGRMPSLEAEAEVDGDFASGDWDGDFELGAPASYEVDLWGRLRAEDSATLHELQAASADVAALKMSLAAETAELYYDIARLRTEIQILDDQVEAAYTFKELTELRQAQGMAGAIDIVQQEQQIEEIHERRRRARLNKSLTLNALSTLLGHPPGLTELPQAQQLPEHPPLWPTPYRPTSWSGVPTFTPLAFGSPPPTIATTPPSANDSRASSCRQVRP